MIDFKNAKVGQYVYCDFYRANVRILSLNDEGGYHGKRVGVAGFNAPHWEFSPARAEAETILHTRHNGSNSSYIASGLMGKQGEPWATTEFDD